MRFYLLLVLTVLLCFCLYPLARASLYPLEHEDVILACGAEFDVPPSLICAVVRQESHFRTDAKSSAGALGLMQLTESTFRELSAQLGIAPGEDIMSPYHNLRCGSYYLHVLYERYGCWETALAAYNAGLGNVDRWLADAHYSLDGQTLHTIPYPETAAYVRDTIAIKENYYKIYKLGS